MLLTIHDMNLRQVASVDNDKQGTLNYFNDLWTRYLETGSSVFDFTVFKKALKTDTGSKKAYNYLNEKAFVSFEYEGETHLFTVRKTVENEKLIKVNCVNLNLELINEYANPYKAPKAMSFKEYCQAMDLLNFTMLTIGLNEISAKKLTAEWEGTDTKLARLLSLARKFGAELEFKTFLNDDSSIKRFVVNVYQENDGSHQGVGRLQPKPLRYGKDFTTLTRTVDKTDIYNMVRPTGTTEDGQIVTIAGLGPWSVTNANGEREFFQSGEGLYAPLSMQMYPAAFTSSTMNDQWIRKDMTVESSNPEVIRSAAYRELKKYAYPAVTYEVEGFTELGIGDTVQVYDDGFSPVLLLEMRVSEQSISFTNKANNKTTFSNFKALENKLSQGIQARLDQMLEEAKPYIIKLATDNGVIFKNQIGQTVVTPTLYKGGKVISNDVTWRWSLDGQVTTGQSYLVRGANVTDTVTLTVAAYVGNAEVAVDEISLVNVTDGKLGTPGTPGRDGRTPYFHVAYAESADGRTGFSLTQTGNKRYMGTYTDFIQADSQDPTKYRWVDMVGTVEIDVVNLVKDSKVNQSSNAYGFATRQVKLEAGKTYWFGARAKKTGGEAGKEVRVWLIAPAWAESRVLSFTGTNYETKFLKFVPRTSAVFDIRTYWFPNGGDRTGTADIDWYMVVESGVPPKNWAPNPSDIFKEIDSKADQVLTQEQLNALNEKANIIQAELEAKASADTLDNWIKAYQDFVKANDTARAQAEKDLISASQRVSTIAKDLGELSDRWNFIDTYMSSSNEGLVIGKNDGSSSMMFNPSGRISMFSAGVEVMYISQGVIHIENGIFSKTIQIGRFREEQYHLNADMNVIRYVGG